MNNSQKLFTAAVGAAAACATWAVGVERYLFTVRRAQLPVLQPGAKPLRVLQLSDLHLAPWQQRKIAWVQSLAQLAPDLVVLTGDQLGHKEAINPLLNALQPLAATGAKMCFVHGSNDYYSPIAKNPMRYLKEPSRLATRVPDLDNELLTRRFNTELGAVDLNNRVHSMTVSDSELLFLGLNDPHIGYHDHAAIATALQQLEAAEQLNPEQVRVGVVHAPYTKSLDFLTDNGCELLLAGHTHGGQLRVPGVGALTSNSDLPPQQARGLSAWYTAENTAFLHVSAGLGTSIYAPVRFCCRPEATLLTLHAVDSQL